MKVKTQEDDNHSQLFLNFSDVMWKPVRHIGGNNETATMLVYQTNPVGVVHVSYVNTSFCANNFAELLFTWLKRLYRGILNSHIQLLSQLKKEIVSARWMMGRGKKWKLLFFSFSFPWSLRAFLFPLRSQPLYGIKRPLLCVCRSSVGGVKTLFVADGRLIMQSALSRSMAVVKERAV